MADGIKVPPYRPYIVRAMYDWMLDNMLTPQIAVNVNYPLVDLPLQYAQNGMIILNISPRAVLNLKIDNQGLSGLELQYDRYLRGVNGKIQYFSDAHGNKLNRSDVYVAPTPGMDIQLTIDVNIQKALEREMNNISDMFQPDMALAIVVSPKTGEVLGMSSLPDFDPNSYQNYSKEVLNRNLPIWASYEPGSTFKIVAPIFTLRKEIS